MRLIPTEDRIVVQPIAPPEKTEGGILLPDPAREEMKNTGRVVAVGPGRIVPETGKRLPMTVKIGDVIYFSQYGGEPYQEGREIYKIIRLPDVVGFLPDPDDDVRFEGIMSEEHGVV